MICGTSSIEKISKTKLGKLANATVITAERIYSCKGKLHKRSIRIDFVTTQNELRSVKLSLCNTRGAAVTGTVNDLQKKDNCFSFTGMKQLKYTGLGSNQKKLIK